MRKLARIKIIASLSALLLVFMSVFGLALVMEKMESQAGMAMVGCPYASEHEGFCPMRASEQLAAWQQLFTAEPTTVFLWLVLAVVFFFLDRGLKVAGQRFCAWRRYRRRLFIRQFFDDLARALSKGIIHPKIYPAVK